MVFVVGFMGICFSHFLCSQACWLHENCHGRAVHLLLVPDKTIAGSKHPQNRVWYQTPQNTFSFFLGLPSVTADSHWVTWKEMYYCSSVFYKVTGMMKKKCQTSPIVDQNRIPDTHPSSRLSLQLLAKESQN